LKDLLQLLMLREAQLQLSEMAENQRVVYGDLSPRETLASLLQKGLVEKAFELCHAFYPSDIHCVLEVLLDKCIALDNGAREEDAYVHLGYEGSGQDYKRALWDLLRRKLEQYDSPELDFQLSKKVVVRLLSSCSRSKLPQWLIARFLPHMESPKDCGFARCVSDPAWLVRQMIHFHMPIEAASLCLKCLPAPEHGITRSGRTWVPQSLLQSLVEWLHAIGDPIAQDLASRIEERSLALDRNSKAGTGSVLSLPGPDMQRQQA